MTISGRPPVLELENGKFRVYHANCMCPICRDDGICEWRSYMTSPLQTAPSPEWFRYIAKLPHNLPLYRGKTEAILDLHKRAWARKRKKRSEA